MVIFTGYLLSQKKNNGYLLWLCLYIELYICSIYLLFKENVIGKISIDFLIIEWNFKSIKNI